MNRKPPLTCCCPQQQQVSEGGFHFCLALQLLLENQNRLHIIFDEISILHAHVNVPGKKSEVRRALKRVFDFFPMMPFGPCPTPPAHKQSVPPKSVLSSVKIYLL